MMQLNVMCYVSVVSTHTLPAAISFRHHNSKVKSQGQIVWNTP